MNVLAPLFAIFNRLDQHLTMPDDNWYEEVRTLIDQIGRNEYQHQVFGWLGFEIDHKMTWDAEHRYYWQREPIKPGIVDGMAAMDHVAATRVAVWYAEQEKVSGKLSTDMGPDWLLAQPHIPRRLSDKKRKKKFAYLQTQAPYLLSKKYPLSYTLAGRLLRGVLHSAAIVRSPEMLEMVEGFGLNCPEYVMDVVHIYAQLPLGETVARCWRLRDRLHDYFPIWQVEKRLRRMGDKQEERSRKGIKESFVATWGFDVNHLTNKVNRRIVEHCGRIELFLTQPQDWKYGHWLPAYILHPFIGAIGKRLIWLFSTDARQAAGIWTPDGFTTFDGMILDWIDNNTIVQLWHPVMAEPSIIAQWQEFLMRQQILQPFRQAFREVYRLSETKPEDASSDNTFAGYILDSDRLKKYTTLLKGYESLSYRWYNGFSTAAGFNIKPLSDLGREGHNYAVSSSISFVMKGPFKAYLDEVHPIPYAEFLREVDFYVRNTCIGNDPEWEGVGDEITRAAWVRYAFGKLFASGEIRRKVLGVILPQLPIRDKTSIEGDYLKVPGYKIHLGSGNVLSDPGDEFVRLRVKGKVLEGIFIPVEQDKMLNMIIEKAILLTK